MRPTPHTSHPRGAAVPAITTRGWQPFAWASLEPERGAISGNDKPERGLRRGAAACKMLGTRSPPPASPPESAARTHHGPRLPPSTHRPCKQVQTCSQFVCHLFGLHPASQPLSFSSRPPSLYLLSPGLAQAPGGAASEWPAPSP